MDHPSEAIYLSIYLCSPESVAVFQSNLAVHQAMQSLVYQCYQLLEIQSRLSRSGPGYLDPIQVMYIRSRVMYIHSSLCVSNPAYVYSFQLIYIRSRLCISIPAYQLINIQSRLCISIPGYVYSFQVIYIHSRLCISDPGLCISNPGYAYPIQVVYIHSSLCTSIPAFEHPFQLLYIHSSFCISNQLMYTLSSLSIPYRAYLYPPCHLLPRAWLCF